MSEDYQSKRDDLWHAVHELDGLPNDHEHSDETIILTTVEKVKVFVSSESQKAADEREGEILDELEDWITLTSYDTTTGQKVIDWIASKRQQLSQDKGGTG